MEPSQDNTECSLVISDPEPSTFSTDTSTEKSQSEPPKYVKIPPTKFVWGEDRVRKMLPRRRLPRKLDFACVDVQNPNELPLCWFGVSFSYSGVVAYAKKHGLAQRRPGAFLPSGVYEYQAWAELIAHFRRKSGLQLELQDVWGRKNPVLVFFSNRDTEWITTRHIHKIQYLLWDMDYPAKIPFKWYLDKRELF